MKIKLLERWYSRIAMETYTGSPWKKRFQKIAISLISYHLFPEFRRRNYPVRKIFVWTLSVVLFSIFGISLFKNYEHAHVLHMKNNEINSLYKRVNVLEHDAKRVVYEEMHDSLLNSASYIRCKIYERSGIVVPSHMPDDHIRLFAKNSRDKKVPVVIYARIIEHESKFHPDAVNDVSGAFGYMQTMPHTFNNVCKRLNLDGRKTPENNLLVGADMLGRGFERWYKKKNDPKYAWEMTLACYAMGDSLPSQLGRVPESVRPFVNYVLKDVDFKDYFKKMKEDI